MDVLKFIIEHWSEIAGYSALGVVIIIVSLFLFALIWSILPKIIDWIKVGRDSYKNDREALLNILEPIYQGIRADPVFFDEKIKNKRRFFYRRHKALTDDNGKIIRFFVRKEFLLTGNPGDGKTSLLKFLFLSKNRSLRRILSNSIGFFFDYKKLNELLDAEGSKQKAELLNHIKSAGYRRYYLYFDGIDELGKNRIEEFFSLVRLLRESQRRVKVIISVREHFLRENKVLFSQNTMTMHKYRLSEWTSDSIEQYGLRLLKSIRVRPDKDSLKRLQESLKKASSYDLLKNPLTMKMYLYLLLKSPSGDSVSLENRYQLYERFVTALIFSSKSHNYNRRSAKKKIEELSEACFNAYEKGEKVVSVKEIDPPSLFKQNGALIHETFFEFFVSRYYFSTFIDQVEKISVERLRVLSHDYSNEYADFISSAIQQLDDDPGKKDFLSNLCTIYYHTLKKPLRSSFALLAGINDTVNYKVNAYLSSHFNAEGEFLTLKNQIIFRLGRMNCPPINELLGNILEFIYRNDDEIRCKEDTGFFIALLRRGCAISSSFLGYEGIELDYVKHMLVYRKAEYIPDYDLANRSHTMIFYGDVKVERDIITFRDENYEIPCWNALSKRINRLSKELPQRLSEMDAKQKKIFYFRLFDLATIYSFLMSRKVELSSEQKLIIENCNIDFKGQSDARHSLMTDIKQQILHHIS